MANKQYYKENIKLTKKDILLMLIVMLFGIAIIFTFINEFYAFLNGSLIMTLGNFFSVADEI